MKSLFILIILTVIMYTVKAQFPEFKFHHLGKTEEAHLGQSSLADLDNDGDLDFIVGASGSTIWWFEFKNAEEWKRHTLGENALTDKGGIACDVDGDGLIDQISGGTWYKNMGGTPPVFKRFENGAIFTYDNIVADIDGDGKNEVLALSSHEGLYIYEIPSNPEKKWKKNRIDDGVPGGIYPYGVGDFDTDGDMDILRSNVWYDNLNGDAGKWGIHRTVSFVKSQGEYANSSRVYVIDFDGDGDDDIVQSESNVPNGQIAWHANKDGKGINWFTHKIDIDTKQDLHTLCVADFDNDGDLDVFSGGGPMTEDLYRRCFIWENTNNEGTEWTKHEILFKTGCFDAVAGDVDADGDIDIVGKNWKDKNCYFLENTINP